MSVFVRFFNVRLEVRPSLKNLFRWRGPFLCSVVVVVVDTCIGTVIAVPVVRCINESSEGFHKVCGWTLL